MDPAIFDSEKIMGIYPYYGMANMHSELMKKIWSKNQPDIRIYLGEQGYWEGPDALKRVRLIVDSPEEEKEIQEKSVGMMAMHCPVCPVIEVAGDGKTAKGVWIGLGLLAMKDRKTGEPTGAYEWDKYGIDFIKEEINYKLKILGILICNVKTHTTFDKGAEAVIREQFGDLVFDTVIANSIKVDEAAEAGLPLVFYMRKFLFF